MKKHVNSTIIKHNSMYINQVKLNNVILKVFGIDEETDMIDAKLFAIHLRNADINVLLKEYPECFL